MLPWYRRWSIRTLLFRDAEVPYHRDTGCLYRPEDCLETRHESDISSDFHAWLLGGVFKTAFYAAKCNLEGHTSEQFKIP